MRKVLIAVVLIAVAVLLTACSSSNEAKKRVLNAKVRYFDGTAEMIELKSFSICRGGVIRLDTAYGDVMYIGANNVMIIQEDAER